MTNSSSEMLSKAFIVFLGVFFHQMSLGSFERSFERLFCLHFTCGKRQDSGMIAPLC